MKSGSQMPTNSRKVTRAAAIGPSIARSFGQVLRADRTDGREGGVQQADPVG